MIVPPDERRRPTRGPARSAAEGIDPGLEAQLRRERARAFGRAVREQLARRHGRSEAAKTAALESRLKAAGQASLRRGAARRGAVGHRARTAHCWLQAPPPPQQSRSPAKPAAPRQPADAIAAVFPLEPQEEPRKRPVSTTAGLSASGSPPAAASPGSEAQSSLSSLTTPSVAGSLDSLPSSWGLHASRKLRRLVRRQQQRESGGGSGTAAGREVRASWQAWGRA